MSKLTSNYSNDWNRYSSDSSPENGKEKQVKYLKKYSKIAKPAFDKEELIRLFNKYNYNDEKIENEIKKKLKSIQEERNENGWVEIKKQKKYSTIENIGTPNRYQHRKSSSYRKQYNTNYDYTNTIPGSSYRGYYNNNNYKYRGGGGYKAQRRPFQECIEVPSDPVLFNKGSEKNMDKSKKEEKKTGPVKITSAEIKDKKEEKKDESQYNDINISNINKEGSLSLGEEEEIENENENDDEEEEVEEMTQEEKNKWRKYYLNKLKTYSNTKKLTLSTSPNKKTVQKKINSQNFTTSVSSLTISPPGFIIENQSEFVIRASYDNPNREYMLFSKKPIYPVMGPIMQPITFPIMMRPIPYSFPEPNTQESIKK